MQLPGLSRAASALLIAVCAACAVLPPRAPEVSGLPGDDLAAPLSAVWVGHATVLLRMGRGVLLTDPNLSNQISVVPRVTRPSLQAWELPPIDAVVLSHPHLDHFDAATLRSLGPRPAIFFPVGLEEYADEILQIDKGPVERWHSVRRAGLTITAVPARHQGCRYGLDFLWNHGFGGWVVEGAGRTIYFAGDTGYDPHLFKEIGARFPHIDVAFVPIAPARSGPPNPEDRWGHVGPELALDVFADVKAAYFVPIHFEAFFSSNERFEEPRRRLMAEVERRGLQSRVLAWRTGQRLVWTAQGPRIWGAAGPAAQAPTPAAAR